MVDTLRAKGSNMSTTNDDERKARLEDAHKRALAKLWQAYATYQEWQEDDGDVSTFCDFVRDELPGLMPVSGG
jgi:hypothetical protein